MVVVVVREEELDKIGIPCLGFPRPPRVFKSSNESLGAICNISKSLTETAFTHNQNALAK